MHKIRSQKGFTAVEIVLVVVALVAIGAAGYFAYQGRQNHVDQAVNFIPKPTPTPAASTPPQSTANITLGGANYTFSALRDWAKSAGAPGDYYKNAKGDVLFVGEDQSLGKPNVDYMWEVGTDTTSGIKVTSKSGTCHPEHSSNFSYATATYKGMTYICNEDASTTSVVVFVAAQGGEILLGRHKYVIRYTVPGASSADFSIFETILGSFKAK